jgi:hypothetical protein
VSARGFFLPVRFLAFFVFCLRIGAALETAAAPTPLLCDMPCVRQIIYICFLSAPADTAQASLLRVDTTHAVYCLLTPHKQPTVC